MLRWNRPSAAMLLLLAATLPPPPDAIASEADARYRRYRNPPKPAITVLPLESRRLDRPAREGLEQALAREIRRLKVFRLVDLPETVTLDSLGQLPPGALAELGETHRIGFVLQARMERAGGRSILLAEIIDTRSGGIRASFREECRCPVEELIATRGPEGVRRMAAAPGLKGLRCGKGMAPIPAPVAPGSRGPDSAGTYREGGPYCMDLFEYPNRGAGEPVSGKTWSEADSLCAAEGKRLCTEDEWELACGGWKGSAYPYGNAYDAGACNTGSAVIRLSGGHPRCRSPFGVYDLSGNLYEWTSSNWGSGYRDKVVKGGNWNSGREHSGCRARFGQGADASSEAIGFRCCMTLRP